jgi:hypothetical protein
LRAWEAAGKLISKYAYALAEGRFAQTPTESHGHQEIRALLERSNTTMNKSELIDVVAKEADLSKAAKKK